MVVVSIMEQHGYQGSSAVGWLVATTNLSPRLPQVSLLPIKPGAEMEPCDHSHDHRLRSPLTKTPKVCAARTQQVINDFGLNVDSSRGNGKGERLGPCIMV